MFRTIQRCMHDRKIPNITRSRVLPTVLSSFDSPRKFDYHKPINKEEPRKWKNIWPKYRVHSQQYREYTPYTGLMPEIYTKDDIKFIVTVPQRGYKATHGDGRPIASWNRQPASSMWEGSDATGTGTGKPHEHAEAEEKEAIWGEINHDYTDMDSVESDGKVRAYESFKKLFKKKTT